MRRGAKAALTAAALVAGGPEIDYYQGWTLIHHDGINEANYTIPFFGLPFG